jgi:hypothetical protein
MLIGNRDQTGGRVTHSKFLRYSIVALLLAACTDLAPTSVPAVTRKATVVLSAASQPVLAWPLHVDGPYSSPVTTVFDHNMSRPYQYNGSLVATNDLTALRSAGTMGTKPAECYRTTNGQTSSLLSVFNYVGPSDCNSPDFLSYDDHPGIDYSYCVGTPIYAPAEGIVRYEINGPEGKAENYNSLTVVLPTGWRVRFLHLNSFYDPTTNSVRKIPAAGCASNLNLAAAPSTPCPECAANGETIGLSRADPIGYTGDYNKKRGGVAPHLHLEVIDPNGIPRDPYGWNGRTMADPYSVTNSSLWVAPSATISPIASGFAWPLGLSVSGSTLAVTDYSGGAVYRVSTTGGPAAVLASGLNSFGPTSVVNDGSNIYWIQYAYPGPSLLKKVPVAGGRITTVASMVNGGSALGADNTYLYFFAADSIRRVRKSGGTITSLASANAADGPCFTVSGGFVYFIDQWQVKKVSVNGGTVTPMTAGLTTASDIVVVGSAVYWTNPFENSNSAKGLFSVPTSAVSAVPTTRIANSSIVALATDGTSLFGLSNGVFRYDLSNFSNATTLASFSSGQLGQGLEVDGEYVYWTYFDSIYKTAK